MTELALFDCRRVNVLGRELQCPQCQEWTTALLFVEGQNGPICKSCHSEAKRRTASTVRPAPEKATVFRSNCQNSHVCIVGLKLSVDSAPAADSIEKE